jgi:hypothetical protein
MLYCYEKRFHNEFVIFAIHKFCYFNLDVSPLHCNHQYHADFDICHDLHGLIESRLEGVVNSQNLKFINLSTH